MNTISWFLLMLISLPCLALDSSDVYLIDDYGIINTSMRRNDFEWSVNPVELDKDRVRFKAQNRELTPWRNIDPYEWLDFKTWEKHRKIKDENPQWRKLFREALNYELMGRVLKCIGLCVKYRGTRKNNIEFMSKIQEGDEILTEKGSALWIVLVDGSIIRLAAKTSISFNEYNISPRENYFLMRLNYGFMSYRSRMNGKYEALDRPETDLAFYPLKVLKANREYHMIHEYRGFDPSERLKYAVVPNPGYVRQYDRLNLILSQNTEDIKLRDTRLLLYTNNLTFELLNSHIDVFHGIRGRTAFKATKQEPHFKRKSNRKQNIMVSFRGYENKNEQKIENSDWYQSDKKGLSLEPAQKKQMFQAVANFTKRIPSILLARELWLSKYSKGLFNSELDYDKFAVNFGYRLWDIEEPGEIESRNLFVKEYIRRTETTNLASVQVAYTSQEQEIFDASYFKRVMALHYQEMRRRHNLDRQVVREMTDTQYYLWTLRYGQKYLSLGTR